MSNTYTPDQWLVICIGEDRFIFAGWPDGKWRQSSPIVSSELKDYATVYTTKSGSTYVCTVEARGVYDSTILKRIFDGAKKAGINVEICSPNSEDTL